LVTLFPAGRRFSPGLILMNDDIVLKVEHVSKKFCPQLQRSILYGITDIGRNMLGMGTNSERLRKGEFWAVEDVSFELRRGESLGLIGPNGSGKSTLLKMLNGIYMPDKGRIEIKGKVGALIEIGAGFHPMLTGRENIYVNGAILGMSKKEIDQKFEAIVDFADIGSFINAPVKTYSSGMYIRLGFAIAVHSEPDILLVDEVLAVGDIAFRNKCYQRMNEIKQNSNISIVFVSHDLYSLEKFCQTGVLIAAGKLKARGKIHQVIGEYQTVINQQLEILTSKGMTPEPVGTGEIKITGATILTEDGTEQNAFRYHDTLRLRIQYETKKTIDSPQFWVAIWRYDGELVSVFSPYLNGMEIKSVAGSGVIECRIEKIPLLTNLYYANVGIYDKTGAIIYDFWYGNVKRQLSFSILPNQITSIMGQYAGICHFESKWLLNQGKVDLKV
jgi:lipopolysaccharide transport system ATP-binding protein